MKRVQASLPAAVLERVAGCAAGTLPADRGFAGVAHHRAGGRRRVLEFRLHEGPRIFAKCYPRRDEAFAAHDLLRSLWERGFDGASDSRVPEPLGCFPDLRVVLMGAAEGECLRDRIDRLGLRGSGLDGAGAWLARLHVSGLRLGPVEGPTAGALRLARRATRAAARYPGYAGLFDRLIEELAGRGEPFLNDGARVLTHGRYHARHVFVSGEIVTAIDLDRVSLADPAKDMGEFLEHLFALGRSRHDPTSREGWASAFVGGYMAVARALPTGLSYWWSHSTLWRLMRTVHRQRQGWEVRAERLMEDFRAVPEREAAIRRMVP